MPIVQTWISDDDYPKYLEYRKTKGAWTIFIRGALNGEEDTVTIKKTPGYTFKRPEVPKIAGVFPASALRDLTKLCKEHGTPLDSRGKCLQKGCKYA